MLQNSPPNQAEASLQITSHPDLPVFLFYPVSISFPSPEGGPPGNSVTTLISIINGSCLKPLSFEAFCYMAL